MALNLGFPLVFYDDIPGVVHTSFKACLLLFLLTVSPVCFFLNVRPMGCINGQQFLPIDEEKYGFLTGIW